MELSPHSLSPPLGLDGIRSLVGVGSLVGPLVHPVLYRRQPPREAIPKYLSGRTSYHRIRLAFHSYPPLIPPVFNLDGCGPPPAGRPVSPWPWVAHPASGLLRVTHRPVQTRFRCGSASRLNLATQSNSSAHYAKGTQSPRGPRCRRPHRASTACGHTVSGSLSLPSPGCFSPFPHGTGALSVAREYLALGGGPPGFPQGFTGPVVLGQRTQGGAVLSATGLSPSMAGRSRPFA